MLAGAAGFHEPYAARVREAQGQVLKLSEHALSLSMGGNPRAAVEDLLLHGGATLNAKLIETAYMVLHRYADKINDVQTLIPVVQDLRSRYGAASSKPALGEQKRQAGGLTLRTGGGGGVKPARQSQ